MYYVGFLGVPGCLLAYHGMFLIYLIFSHENENEDFLKDELVIYFCSVLAFMLLECFILFSLF